MSAENEAAFENVGSPPGDVGRRSWGDIKGRTPREKRRISDLCASFFLSSPVMVAERTQSSDVFAVARSGMGSGGDHTLTLRARGAGCGPVRNRPRRGGERSLWHPAASSVWSAAGGVALAPSCSGCSCRDD